MIVKGRFSLDTNILVCAVDRDTEEIHERSKELIGRAARSGSRARMVPKETAQRSSPNGPAILPTEAPRFL